MSFVRVVELLSQRKVVKVGVTFYALIDERIHWVIMQDGVLKLINHDPRISINEFALQCDKFDERQEDAIQDIPEEEIILSPDGEYDFSKMPKKHACLECLTVISRETAVLERRFAHCPCCGNQFYKAPRVDGRRDDPSWANGSPSHDKNHPRMPRGSGKKEKEPVVEKPKPPTTEEILASGTLKPAKRKLKLKFVTY